MNTWAACRQLRLLCDSVRCSSYDRVMPLFEDESLYLGQRVLERPARRVLDLGTGSGVLSVLAALQAEQVVGVDINPHALACARVSAELCGVRDKCSFLEGDLYDPVHGERFDLIVVNPPFVPLPPGERMYLSADGGPDGAGVIRRVIEGANDHLTDGGRLLLLTMSLGDHREPMVFGHLRDAFRARKVRITTTHIYEDERIHAGRLTSLFQEAPGYAAWCAFLAEERLTHVYYMLHEVEAHDRYLHVQQRSTFSLPQTPFSGSWAARVNRLGTWFKKVGLHPRSAESRPVPVSVAVNPAGGPGERFNLFPKPETDVAIRLSPAKGGDRTTLRADTVD